MAIEASPAARRHRGEKRKAVLIASGPADNDIRILKEARSLAAGGRAVEIFHFPENAAAAEASDEGPETLNIALTAVPWRRVRARWLALGAAGVAGVVGLAAISIALAGDRVNLFNGALLLIGLVLAAGFALAILRPGAAKKIARLVADGEPPWRGVIRFIDHRAKTAAVDEALGRIDGPYILHAHEPAALSMAGAARAEKPAPLIYDAHELYEHVAGATPASAAGVEKIHAAYVNKADRMIVVSDEIGAHYHKRYGLAAPPATVANAVAPKPLAAYDGRLHDAAGLTRETKVLLYHGGFTRERGLRDLIAAMKHAPGWRLVMMGAGVLEPVLREDANALGDARARVRFLPPVPQADLLDWVQGASLGAIPYEDTCLNHRFCAPNKLWEYPAAGVPVLARRLTSMAAIIETNAIGWTFESDADGGGAIASALAAIDAPALAKARAACAAFIADNNWALYEARLLAIYDEIDRRGPAAKT